MALNLPALPPLPAYPTGSDATQEAIVNWRELARLHTWHQELLQRESCHLAHSEMLPAVGASLDKIADAWTRTNTLLEGMPALTSGLPVADVIALLTAVVDAIKK